MEALEIITQKQAIIGETIEKIYVNFKKDSASRKTKDYLQVRLRNLEEEWTQFEANEVEIATYRDSCKEHPYFSHNFQEEVKQCYMKTKELLKATLEQLERKPSTSTAPQQKQLTVTPVYPEKKKTEVKAQAKAGDGKTSHRDEDDEGEDEINTEQRRRLRRQKALMSILERLLTTTEEELGTPRSKVYYSQRITTFEKYWTDISKLHQDIMTEVHQYDYNLDIFFEMECHYLEVMTQVLIQHLVPPTRDQTVSQRKISQTAQNYTS